MSHPQICLVGLEPVSNFILLERYAEDRSAATWTQALDEALRGLRVEVVQGCSVVFGAQAVFHKHVFRPAADAQPFFFAEQFGLPSGRMAEAFRLYRFGDLDPLFEQLSEPLG